MLTLNPQIRHEEGSSGRPIGEFSGLVLTGLPEDHDAALALLADPRQFEPMRDGTMQADLEVPAGTWRVWMDRRIALWIGARRYASPAIDIRQHLDLFELAAEVSDAGLMLRDMALRTRTGWGPTLRAHRALRGLANCAHGEVDAIRGVWGISSDRAIRVEIHDSGRMFARDEATLRTIAQAIGHR